MKVTVQNISASQKKLEITIPHKVVKQHYEEHFGDVMRRAQVKGFRPGKVPRNIVERQYGDVVRGQVTAELMEENAKKAIEQEKLETVAPPVMEPGVFKEKEDYTFVANVEIWPDVELKEYKGIEAVHSKAVVTDDELDKALDDLRKRNAQLKRSEKPRPSLKGDVVTMDMAAESKGMKISHEENFQVEVGAGMMPEQFEDALVGLNIGDHKKVDVAYPIEDKHALSGQEVSFEFTVKEIQEKILPALDEEFAKDMGRESLEDLKSYMKSRIFEARQEVIDRKAKEEIMKAIREKHPLDLPPSIVSNQRKSMVEELKKQFQASGIPFMENQFEKELTEKARERVHDDLLLKSIAEKEKIEASDEQVDEKIKKMAEARGQNPEKFRDAIVGQGNLEVIRYSIRAQMTLDFLLQNAILKEGLPEEEKDAPSKPEAKKKAAPKRKKPENKEK